MISIMSKTDSVARILALAGGNGGGGTTGTTNYLELANKPMINGVELIGNKTTEDLGIEAGVSEETLIQTIAQESAARQKEDNLLQGEIETKITPANIKAGEGIFLEQSGLDVTINATANYETATDQDIKDIFSLSADRIFNLSYTTDSGTEDVSVYVSALKKPGEVLGEALYEKDRTIGAPYELTISSEVDLLDTFYGIFIGLTNLTKLDITNLKTGAIIDTKLMSFVDNDTALVEVDMSGLSLPTITEIGNMFRKAPKLTTINMSNCSFPNLTKITHMFVELPALKNLQLNLGQLPNLQVASDVIRDCHALVSLDLSQLDVSSATNLMRFVIFADSLESIILPMNISSATTLDSIVRNAPKLETIDFTGRTNNKVTSFQWGFAGNTALKTLDLTMIDFSNVTGILLQHMFQNCSSLEEVKVNSSWNTSSASKDNIFDGAAISNVTIVEV